MRDPETAERMAIVVGMRRRDVRKPWREIADHLGISITRCRQLYSQALAEAPVENVDELRQEEAELVDDAVKGLLTIARNEGDDDVSPRTRVEAWSAIRAWAERKAKLLGLDAPQVVTTMDYLDREIAGLVAQYPELAGSAAGEAEAPA